MDSPPAVEPISYLKAAGFVRIRMRLHKRTFKLIRKMAELEYNDDTGQVISACVKVLNWKRLRLFAESESDTLSSDSDLLLARMQGPGPRNAMQAAFHASPKQLGKAAVAAARKRG